MGERVGLLANETTASKDLKYEQTQKRPVKLDEIVVQGDELLFKLLFLKVNTTLNATVILFLFPLTIFSDPHLTRGLLHYIVSF